VYDIKKRKPKPDAPGNPATGNNHLFNDELKF